MSEPGCVFWARSIACRIAALFVTSPVEVNTTVFGGLTPTPKVLRVFWLVSYADLPGIEKLWYQRLESLPAENAPITVRTIQIAMTHQRRRATTWARRARNPS